MDKKKFQTFDDIRLELLLISLISDSYIILLIE
jgi:hypothetical protein